MCTLCAYSWHNFKDLFENCNAQTHHDFLQWLSYIYVSRDSSVGTATRPLAGQPKNFRILPAGMATFSLFQTFSGLDQPPVSITLLQSDQHSDWSNEMRSELLQALRSIQRCAHKELRPSSSHYPFVLSSYNRLKLDKMSLTWSLIVRLAVVRMPPDCAWVCACAHMPSVQDSALRLQQSSLVVVRANSNVKNRANTYHVIMGHFRVTIFAVEKQ